MYGFTFVEVTFDPGEGDMDKDFSPFQERYEFKGDGIVYPLVPDSWGVGNAYVFTAATLPWPPTVATIQCRTKDIFARNEGGSYIRPGPVIDCSITV